MGAEISLDLVPPEQCQVGSAPRSRERVLRQFTQLTQARRPRRSYIGRHPTDQFRPTTPCEQSSTSLERTSLRQLRRTGVQRGVYVLVRTIVQAALTPDHAGFATVVEDPAGDVEIVSLYNYGRGTPAAVVLCVGAYMVIKEPYVADYFDFETIRVMHPTDIIFLDAHDARVSSISWKSGLPIPDYSQVSATQWKEGGNAFFANEGYWQAFILYTCGIMSQLIDAPEAPFLSRLNRAATAFRMGRFETALLDTDICLEEQPDNPKALYRKANAHYHLRQWEPAEQALTALLANSPSMEVAHLMLAKVRTRIEESRGHFSLDRLATQAGHVGSCSRVEFGDFAGPLEVRLSPTYKRLGVFLTQDVQQDQILIIEKALAQSHIAPVAHNIPDREYLLRCAEQRAFNELVEEVVRLVFDNPFTIGPKVAQLPVATNITSKLRPELAVDAWHIRAVCDLNTRITSRLRRLPPAPPPPFERVNSWWDGAPYCLFHLPALINPACIANTSRIYFGDVCVVRAVKDLKAGTELTEGYTASWFSLRLREQLHAKAVAVPCGCELCCVERAEPPEETAIQAEALGKIRDVEKRLGSVYGASDVKASDRPSVTDEAERDVEAIIAALQGSYDRCERPMRLRHGLLEPLMLKRAIALFHSDADTICDTSLSLLQVIAPDGIAPLGPFASRAVEIYLTIAQWTKDTTLKFESLSHAMRQQVRYSGLQEPTLRKLGLAIGEDSLVSISSGE